MRGRQVRRWALFLVVKIDNIDVWANQCMDETTRPVNWVRAARKSFAEFPQPVRDRMNAALTIAAQGGKADTAKPLKGLGPGVLEIAVRYRRNAWRVVYVVELGESLW